MADPAPFSGILETALYCTTETEEATRRFYEDLLHLRRVSHWAYRIGPNVVFLLFNSDETHDQDSPPPHGATGPGHTCFTVDPDAYEHWKTYLQERGVEVTDEIKWRDDLRSFYFDDPAGNVLEIAEGDMWPS